VQKCGRSKNRTFYCSYFVLFFRIIAFSARNELDKAVIEGGSNNAGIWGRNPQPPEAVFTVFFPKNTLF